MDKVEKVARAIYEARGAHEPPRAWRKWEDIGDEARAVWCQCATAALAAMGEPASHPLNTSAVVSHEPANVRDKAVAYDFSDWPLPEDVQLPPMTERGVAGQIMDLAWPHYLGNNVPADFWNAFGEGVRFTLHVASPRPEAVGEDWRAVDDAIWFYLGHENHKPEEVARLRRMSGVVLGLAGYAER